MSSVRLKATGKKFLREASRDAIETYFQSRTSAEKSRKWINRTNRYRISCSQRFYQDVRAVPPTVDSADMQAYIAASSPGHVIDSWSLLGRAVDAALRCDTYSAVHLAYYAELRAAMALLACEGIGIFSTRHATVDATGSVHLLPQCEFLEGTKWNGRYAGTHAVIWPCLRHWSGLAKAHDFIDELFQPANTAISQWLIKLGSAVPAKAILRKWLSVWGLDLAIFEDDHESRNLASYRPSVFRLPPSPPVVSTIQFVSSLWNCFEPSGGGKFRTLEQHLLKRALNIAGLAGPFTDGHLAAAGVVGAEAAKWLAILNGATSEPVLALAEQQSAIDSTECHLQIMARAGLLLALATAASNRHLRKTGYTSADLKFWWERHGIERGLWDDGDDIDPLDVWADVNECLESCAAWCNEVGTQKTLKRWRRANTESIDFLGSFELVGFWGLLP